MVKKQKQRKRKGDILYPGFLGSLLAIPMVAAQNTGLFTGDGANAFMVTGVTIFVIFGAVIAVFKMIRNK